MLPNLKVLRREKGISQQTLADVLGISQQSINNYENKTIEPDIDMLKQMADYFGTTIDYITGYANTRYPVDNTAAYHLNADEGNLINQFRALSPKERACVATVIKTLLEKQEWTRLCFRALARLFC